MVIQIICLLLKNPVHHHKFIGTKEDRRIFPCKLFYMKEVIFQQALVLKEVLLKKTELDSTVRL